MEETNNDVLGYSVPIHQSLTTPILFAGVPRTFAIISGTIFASLGLGMQSWWIIPIGIVVHFLAASLTKFDLHFFTVLMRHLRHKTYYGV